MKDLSEKEIEKEYKEIKMAEIPDLWDDIEKKLPPRRRKSGIRPRHLISMAAAAAVLVLLVPVLHVIRQGEKVGYDSSAVNESAETCDSAAREEKDGETEKNNIVDQESSSPADASDVRQLTLQVQMVEETGEGMRIYGTVVESETGEGSVGKKVTVLYEYDENAYTREDFSGVLTISCVSDGETVKLLEILP